MPSTLLSPSPGVLGRLAALARDIKLSHSVFALPFALLATFLAAAYGGQRPGAATLLLIVLCMVLARTAAMTVNRWADARLDAENPRTAARAIPSGRLQAGFVLAIAIASGLGFIVVAAGFWLLDPPNPWPLILSPLILAWLAFYSFTKRFTWLCHLFLGSSLALSPLAAVIAVEPAFLGRPEPYLLFAMVLCWVAGFDVIYALQDVAIDRTAGLHSMPASLGVPSALAISRLLHALSFSALLMLARLSPSLSSAFAVGVALVAGLLLLEHAIVWKSRTHHINLVFFTLNGVISLLLGGLGIWDVWRTTR